MRILGLTGGIACGKSNISQVLQRLGAVIIDGDVISRRLTAPNGAALPLLRQTFGDHIFSADGSLNRPALGQFVFADESNRAKLDAIMQPLIRQEILQDLSLARSRQVSVAVLDMPLLYEKNLDTLCDSVWCAYLPEETQLQRLMLRNGYSQAEALSRIRSQMPCQEKARRANVVIDTSGTIEETQAKIPALFQQELDQAAIPTTPKRRRRSEHFHAGEAESVPQPAVTRSSAPAPDANTVPTVPRRKPSSPREMTKPTDAPPHPQKKAEETILRKTPSAIQPEVQETSEIHRPQPQPETPKQNRSTLPVWMSITAGLLCLLMLALLAGNALMQAYLKQRADAKAAAHTVLLEQHPLSYTDAIFRYAEQYGLQPGFVASIILNESSYRTFAESNIGARGLMQLMPETAQWIAGKLDVPNYSFDMLWEADVNIRFGCWYLRYLSDLFGGDPVSVTAAYHAGQGTISSWRNNRTYCPDGRTLTVDLLPEGNTKNYARKVMKAYAIYDAIYFHAFNQPADGGNAVSAP